MKAFMGKNFLLTNDTAKILYHEYAAKMPILDYHCHINPAEIAEDRTFDTITQVWLGGDHYKWRAIRANGVEESLITGKESSDREKFDQWAETLPKLIGNPLYHWTHLELQRYFNIELPLSPDTADKIWTKCNKMLQQKSHSVRGIIRSSNVKLICTTDDPADDLRYHQKIKEDASCEVQVLPAFRPDRAININKPDFSDYMHVLSNICGQAICSYTSLLEILKERLSYFVSFGCKTSDHGLDALVYSPASTEMLEDIFTKRMRGEMLNTLEVDQFKTGIILALAEAYHDNNVVMQLHYGTARSVNQRAFEHLGADTGFDCIAPQNGAEGLIGLFNELNERGKLPKTILYPLSANDSEMLTTIMGCFQGCDAACKLQLGSAWWFNDHKTGMEKQLKDFANLSVLGNFVGMLTDSRSFLSYTRHEYFRRILCNLIGTWVEDGEYPNDLRRLGQLVQDISYNNAVRYFNFDL